jgi:hypothetical protein
MVLERWRQGGVSAPGDPLRRSWNGALRSYLVDPSSPRRGGGSLGVTISTVPLPNH